MINESSDLGEILAVADIVIADADYLSNFIGAGGLRFHYKLYIKCIYMLRNFSLLIFTQGFQLHLQQINR